LQVRPRERVLEIGCGMGVNAEHCTGRYVGVDINELMLKKGKEKYHRGILLQAVAARVPFPAGTFDKVVLTYVLSGIPNNRSALQEALRVVKPDGIVGVLDFSYRGTGPDGGVVRLDLGRLVDWCGARVLAERHLFFRRAFWCKTAPLSMYFLRPSDDACHSSRLQHLNTGPELREGSPL
jgi:ubiquinone/menaquinone biosynthesis C-methylase UbiE